MTPPQAKNFAPPLSGQAVVVFNRSLTVTGLNAAASQIIGGGLRPGSVFRLEEFFQGPCAAQAQAALDQVLSQGEPVRGMEGQVLGMNQQYFACEYALDPIFDQSRQVAGVILTLRDLEFDPLQNVPEPEPDIMPHVPRLGYHTLVENLAEGVFTINTRCRITSFNQAAERITGYRREEVLGHFCWEIFRSQMCESNCPLKTTMETGVTRMDQDVRMLSKDGRHISVLCNTTVVKKDSGHVVGAVESFRLISGLDPSGQSATVSGQSFSDIIGATPPMRQLFEMLPDVAASEASVFITGESGTGKELVARAIHQKSPRCNGPFMAVNCSALAENLLESELFGHEKAAFTGAVRSRVGRFELTKGGTLFFDEIGDLKPELQIKLLRVLEERVFERVGGSRVISLDARIIAATNRNLKEALQQGAFREDLYYRLRTVPIDLPPLRERRDDIPILVNHFIKTLNQTTGKEVRSVDPKVLQIFMNYAWPGNIRELERVMEYAFVFVKGPVIFPSSLPALDEMLRPGLDQPEPGTKQDPSDGRQGERQEILQALEASNGKRQEAARLLGISRTSLWRRMKELGLA